MDGTSIEIISLIISIFGLLGWLMKYVIKYFTTNSNDKLKYIEQLVEVNQKNTEEFMNAISHQQTLNREMQARTVEALQGLERSISISNEVNKQVVEFMRHGKV